MAKRKKKDEILDTSADKIMLDLSAPEEGRRADGILSLNRNFVAADNITVSFRIPKDVLDHFKQISREISLKNKEDINWQKVLVRVGLEKYPMKGEK